ncbi:MAG TPA: T9SS type A sorting domain-containing protein, partial [Candidatus Kapabacteria bacterium]|nr:T9SS type A sorting domain-containing protein [Candidatus Kapabacteria bacterium]
IHSNDVAKDGWESTNGGGGFVLTDLALAVAKGSASTKSSAVFTAGQLTASINTGDSAGVELGLSFPASSVMIGFIPDTVLLTVGFDSKFVRLDSVIQSGGWIVKRIIAKGNTAEIAFYNSAHIAIAASIDFGRMVFTALNASANSSALVYVADMKAESSCSIVMASPDIETAFLRRILVNAAAAVPTDNSITASSVLLYPNPATNSVRISYGGFTKEPVTLSIIDATGKLVLTRTIAQQASSEYVQSLEGISSGSYTILVDSSSAHLDIIK